MKPKLFTYDQIRAKATQRPPDYLWRLSIAILRTTDEGIVYDLDHHVFGDLRNEFNPRMRPPERIPDDHDPVVERRRLRAGGCCGKPAAAGE